MALVFTPLHKLFGAEVTGIDMRGRLAPEVAREIDAAMDRYAVLLFRDQAMTQSQQVAMAESFGTLDPGLKKLTRAPERMEHEVLIDISNLGMDGRPVARDDRKLITGLANQLWHSDSSFQRNMAQHSMLSAVQLPSRVWRHEWRLGDLVMWDNRTTLHRGRRYDLSEPRELRRTTTMDYAVAAEAAA